MSDFWYWSIGRIVYLILGLIFCRDARLIGFMFSLILSLVCVWFGDELGGFEGVASKGYIRKTPGIFMKFGGWVLLSLPITIGAIFIISKNR